MQHPYSASDAFNLLAGPFAEGLSDILQGDTQKFAFASRGRRQLLLCLFDCAPAQFRSAILRFGHDAPADQLISWALERSATLLKPVLKRLPAVALANPGQYSDLHQKMLVRSRTGRVLCQFSCLSQTTVDVVLALPDPLIEQKLINNVGTMKRATAVAQLFQMAVEDGSDVSNLGAALRTADDMQAVEGILERAVVPDRMPMSPYPDHPNIVPVTSAAALRKLGARFRNCLRHPFQFQTHTGEARSFFIWSGLEEAIVAVQRDARGWRLGEVKLYANREPAQATMAEIVAAFRQVGVPHRPDPQDLLLSL